MEHAEVETRLVKLEEKVEEEVAKNTKAHERFYNEFREFDVHKGIQTERQDQILKTLEEIKNDVAELKSKPAKRWEVITNTALQWVVVAILGAVVLMK